MLISFAAKTFAARAFALIWGIAGGMPVSWVYRPLHLRVFTASSAQRVLLPDADLVVYKRVKE